jgi:uncharacterized protein (DUF983 family)
MSGCCAPDSSGCGCGDPPERILSIEWQRLVSGAGGTCPRCAGTEAELMRAHKALAAALAPLGIRVDLTSRSLDEAAFKTSPGESNRIWVAGRPLEDWLGAEVGATPCCDECGDEHCRTIAVDGAVHEVVPAEAVIQVGLLAAADLMSPH